MAKFNEYDYGSTDFAQSNDFNSLENEKRAWRIEIETKIEKKIEDAEKSIKDNTDKAKGEINNTVNTSTTAINGKLGTMNVKLDTMDIKLDTIDNNLNEITSVVKTNQGYLKNIMDNLKTRFI